MLGVVHRSDSGIRTVLHASSRECFTSSVACINVNRCAISVCVRSGSGLFSSVSIRQVARCRENIPFLLLTHEDFEK